MFWLNNVQKKLFHLFLFELVFLVLKNEYFILAFIFIFSVLLKF